MIESRDLTGLTVAVIGHAALIAAALFFAQGGEKPTEPANEPIQVTLADDVGLVSAAPDPSTEPPAEASQGEQVPDDTEVAPPDPAPEKKLDPAPAKQPSETPKPPVKQNNQNQQTKPPTRTNNGQRQGLQLADSTLRDGTAPEKTNGEGTKSEATMTGDALMNITTAIKRQVQPCADRQVSPAPEASQIIAVVQLRLKPNGALESVRIVDHKGVNDSNQRYVARVDDAVEAIFAACTPIRGLPAELYDVPRGWRSLKFNYRLTN